MSQLLKSLNQTKLNPFHPICVPFSHVYRVIVLHPRVDLPQPSSANQPKSSGQEAEDEEEQAMCSAVNPGWIVKMWKNSTDFGADSVPNNFLLFRTENSLAPESLLPITIRFLSCYRPRG